MAGDWESNPDLNGFAHTGTGSAGDIMDYQIITTLPTITSAATSLSVLNFYDSLQKGLKYNQDACDVKIEFFTDAACTDKVASWNMNSGKFSVAYEESDGEYHMTIDVTSAGLEEINNLETLLEGSLYAGYSNHTLRITYSATIVSDNNVIFGENGNENEVVLTWKRSSQGYYDTLKDDCHVYTFGIDLIKVFSNMDSQTATQNGMFEHVKFKVRNETDGYWVVAALNAEEGIYYATGVTAEESEATVFTPVTYAADTENPYGHIMVKGLEDDEYVLTEIETVNGYTLLKDDIHVVITAEVDETRACDVYTEDTLGLLQNDPHYALGCNKGTEDLTLANIPQKHLAHNHLTAHATVDGNDVTMLEDRGSLNAEAPLTVKNTPGLNPPPTGDDSAKMMGTVGVIMAFASVFMVAMLVIPSRKKNEREV
jgi:fimbrial isopeptide formation D2 family protein